MNPLHANFAISISELKRNPSELIRKAHGETIVILNRNTPTAYLVSPEKYQALMETIEDIELTAIAKKRLIEKNQPIEIDLDDL